MPRGQGRKGLQAPEGPVVVGEAPPHGRDPEESQCRGSVNMGRGLAFPGSSHNVQAEVGKAPAAFLPTTGKDTGRRRGRGALRMGAWV